MHEFKVLKNAIKMQKMENKIEIMENKNQIQAKENQILKLEHENQLLKMKTNDHEIVIMESKNQVQAKENQIIKLENENKLLKTKTNDHEEVTPLKNEKQIERIIKNYSNIMSTDDLLFDGVEEFFLRKNYKEWFGVMTTRLTKNSPYIFEMFVLVKVTKLGDPKIEYTFTTCDINNFYDNQTQLNIFDKGWRHETAKVSILHPKLVQKSIQMKEGDKYRSCSHWTVDKIPNEYIDEDGYFIVLCLKK